MRRKPATGTSTPDDGAAGNRPLIEDIRLLGRILGDVLREQEGEEAYQLVERRRSRG
jgi:phosphoenolpyruvate carboxylase